MSKIIKKQKKNSKP